MPEKIKPIKRSVQLQSLSREHHDGLLFSWKIRQGLRNGTENLLLKQFTVWYWKNHFEPHFEQEEKILLPFIEGHPFAAQLKKEHEDIRNLVLELDDDPDSATFYTLASLIDNHIRFEERHLFGYVESILSQDQLDSVSEQLASHPVCDKEWSIPFWNKK